MVRPRGWHLPEKHILVDGKTCSGSLMDFALFFFNSAHHLIKNGSGKPLLLASITKWVLNLLQTVIPAYAYGSQHVGGFWHWLIGCSHS